MKKIIVILVLVLMLLLPADMTAYAAEDEPTYNEYIDEIVGMSESQWSIYFEPEFNYKYEFGFFGMDRLEGYKKWEIKEMYFSFDRKNKHEGEFLVGYDTACFDIMFNFEFQSLSNVNVLLPSSATFVYPLSDFYSDGSFSCAFSYAELMNSSENYLLGYPTVVSSVEIVIYNKVFNTCGTSIIYDFTYENNNFNKQICEKIECYSYNPISSMVFVGDGTDIYREDETFDYFMYTLPPGSVIDVLVGLLRFLGDFITCFPRMVYSVFELLIGMFLMIPKILHSVIPFLPESIINAIVFCIAFGFLWGVLGLIKKLKG